MAAKMDKRGHELSIELSIEQQNAIGVLVTGQSGQEVAEAVDIGSHEEVEGSVSTVEARAVTAQAKRYAVTMAEASGRFPCFLTQRTAADLGRCQFSSTPWRRERDGVFGNSG